MTIHTSPSDAAPGWHLDKSIGIALVVATLLQICMGSWYVSRAYSSIEDLERRVVLLETTFQTRTTMRDAQNTEVRQGLATLSERLARVEASQGVGDRRK